MGKSGTAETMKRSVHGYGALLNDAVEDQGGLPRLRDIEANFGKKVAKIIEGCTDSFEEDSGRIVHRPPWERAEGNAAGFGSRQAVQRPCNS